MIAQLLGESTFIKTFAKSVLRIVLLCRIPSSRTNGRLDERLREKPQRCYGSYPNAIRLPENGMGRMHRLNVLGIRQVQG